MFDNCFSVRFSALTGRQYGPPLSSGRARLAGRWGRRRWTDVVLVLRQLRVLAAGDQVDERLPHVQRVQLAGLLQENLQDGDGRLTGFVRGLTDD